MNNTFNKVLVLATHTDDGELGAGGFISKLIENGSEIYYSAFPQPKKVCRKGYLKIF